MKNNSMILSAYPVFVMIKKIRMDHYLSKFTPGELYETFDQLLSKSASPQSLPHYALVTLLDDAILNSGWSYSEAWLAQSLQSIYYSEQMAGQGLLDKMEAILSSPDLNSELEEFLYYCYCWRSEAHDTDSLFLALKSRLKLTNPNPPPHEFVQPPPPKLSLKKMLLSACGMLMIVYVWMQMIITWDVSRIQEVITREHQH